MAPRTIVLTNLAHRINHQRDVMSGAARMLARREPEESARAYPVGEGSKSREEEDVAAVATKLADATNQMPPSWEGAPARTYPGMGCDPALARIPRNIRQLDPARKTIAHANIRPAHCTLPPTAGAANAFGSDHVHKASPHVERRAKLGTIPMPKVPAVPDQVHDRAIIATRLLA